MNSQNVHSTKAEWTPSRTRSAVLIWRNALVVALCCATSAVALADSDFATIRADVSAATVRVAEPLTLELTVVAPVGSTVDFPAVGSSLGGFDVTAVVDRADVPSAENVQQRIWTRRLTLESIVTGEMEIPALEIRAHRNADSQILKSDAIPIRVASVLEERGDPTVFRDIHSVIDVDLPQTSSRAWLWWSLAGFGGAAVALMAVMAKRKSWITPRTWAVRELQQLRQSASLQTGDSEAVIQKLTIILRDYLELQFEIAAPVQTTCELLEVINGRNIMSAAAIQRLEGLFKNADLVRFAGVQLTQTELTKVIDDAEQLIEQTSRDLPAKSATAETARVG